MARFASKVPEECQRLFDEDSVKLTATERGRRDEILQVLIAARRLFTVQEVSKVLAFNHVTQTIDNENIDFEPAEEITRLCQPLVKVSSNHRVLFIHGSAKEFLLQRHLTKRESELFLARKCLGILTRQFYRDRRLAATCYADIFWRGPPTRPKALCHVKKNQYFTNMQFCISKTMLLRFLIRPKTL
jgi:hypothetical protein